MFGQTARLAVLEDWRNKHDTDCERRYVRIDERLEKMDRKLDEQTSDFRLALKDHSAEQASARRGIYALLWAAVGSLLLMLITGLSTLVYNLLPALHR